MTVDPDLMTPQHWARVPTRWVLLEDLQPTQNHLGYDGLWRAATKTLPPCGDRFPWIVHEHGRLRVHNGHHRLLVAALQGERWCCCRVLDLDGDGT